MEAVKRVEKDRAEREKKMMLHQWSLEDQKELEKEKQVRF